MQHTRLPSASSLLTDISACVGFYTRLPVKGVVLSDFAAAQWAAPVAGAVIGLLVGIALWLITSLGVPPGVSAALALATGIALTGGLHEDGLADVADGFGGGRTQDDKLAIMTDSRIGTYGTLALVLSLLTRWAALSTLAVVSPAVAIPALIAAHTASRALMPGFMVKVASARPYGLSADIGAVEGRTALIALGIGALALLLNGLGFAIVTIALLALLFFALRRLALAQIGGQTGDVLGSLQQGGEILILCVCATLLA
ncbi:adenosylcobinamide-GDP ribazoletransferase [Mesorhizobium sp. CAU 1732]|uniref:adenosylcobinamide-GDP ribazoletransferase n=1 Tax=Mesorhizobium sp. CAU 1732 TaxID=3140358 RepID=UPI00326041B6